MYFKLDQIQISLFYDRHLPLFNIKSIDIWNFYLFAYKTVNQINTFLMQFLKCKCTLLITHSNLMNQIS